MCQDALSYLSKLIATQPSLFRVHQIEEDGRGELMELSQDIPSGRESCDLENPREELREKESVSTVSPDSLLFPVKEGLKKKNSKSLKN